MLRAAAALRGVSKSFGATRALERVDLELGHGEIVALLGPNGAGKTTALSIMLGLRRPDSGTAELFGDDPRRSRAREAVGVTPQESGFPPTLRVREIVALVQAHFRSPVPAAELLERFGLARLGGRQAGGLSGGARRRLSVALAFAGGPQVVFLDEPTAGLDVEMRRSVWGEIRAHAAAGKAALITTHHIEEAEALASRVAVLARGQVIAEAAPGDLTSRLGARGLEAAFVALTARSR